MAVNLHKATAAAFGRCYVHGAAVPHVIHRGHVLRVEAGEHRKIRRVVRVTLRTATELPPFVVLTHRPRPISMTIHALASELGAVLRWVAANDLQDGADLWTLAAACERGHVRGPVSLLLLK